MESEALTPSSTADISGDAVTIIQPTKAEIDSLLRKKRKARQQKSCYPCKHRKVACDLGKPCSTCISRTHPELCDYNPREMSAMPHTPIKSEHDVEIHSSMPVSISQPEIQQLFRKLEHLESNIEDLRREIREQKATSKMRTPQISSPSTPINHKSTIDPVKAEGPIPTSTTLPGFHTMNYSTGQTVHLGGSSVPALIMALGQGNRDQSVVQEIIRNSMLPLFGLDNETATYPFVDLWSLANGWQAKAIQLAKTLPADSQCLAYLQSYRDLGHVIFPGVADIAGFEHALTVFLMRRAACAEQDPNKMNDPLEVVTEDCMYDKNYNWVGLLFAVMASGCQCSNLPRKERELTSQVYVCCSIECLRFANFLAVPTLESVQTLLVVCYVLSNSMNAGTAWNLIGLTIRMAQSLGLHQSCPPELSLVEKGLRTKIWHLTMWQDSLLSITYDRASFSVLSDHSSMANKSEHNALPHFHSAMLRICKVGLDVVRDRSKVVAPQELIERISRSKNEIDTVLLETAVHLRDTGQCRSLRESIEHWALYLHVSYIKSELCRPAISPSADSELRRLFAQLCLDSLINTVEAWLGFQNITSYARQSWASVNRALSSALLLGIMGEHVQNERCRRLLVRFIGLLGDMTSNIEPHELAAPMTRAIEALQKLNIPNIPLPFPLFKNKQYNNHPHNRQPRRPQIYPVDHQPYSAPAAAMNMHNPPRFIEDIALGTPSTSDSCSSKQSPAMSSNVWPISSMPRSIIAPNNVEEQSPYTVLNTILWGGEIQNNVR